MAVVTFNIRYDNPGDPVTWDQRKKPWWVPCPTGPLGFQEALPHQLDFLAESLPEHDHMGWAGRMDCGAESTVPPWRRARFDLLHAETLWLSETPQEAGSVGWDAALPGATVVLLHDRQTEKVFRVINTHFSHIGEKARAASAQLLSGRFSGGAEVNLLLGDFNAEPDAAPLRTLAGRLQDAYADKRCRRPVRTPALPRVDCGGHRIDHILVDGGEVLWYCLEERILEGFT